MDPPPPPNPGEQYLPATPPPGIRSPDRIYRWLNGTDEFRDPSTRASNILVDNSSTPENQSDIDSTVGFNVSSMHHPHPALGVGNDMPTADFGQEGMQAGPGLDRNNQQANGITSNFLSTQEPAINYNMSGNEQYDTDILSAPRCENSGMDSNSRDNAPRSIYDGNGRTAYLSNPAALQHGNDQYPNNMMPINTSSSISHNNNTQAYGHSTFQNDMTTGMMGTMDNDSAGLNTQGLAGNNHYNNTIPSTLQSIQRASFASDQQNHAPYYSNVQAGLLLGPAARLININQDTSNMIILSTPRQLNNAHGYGMSDSATAQISHMQGINGHREASTFPPQHTVQNYEDHMAVNFQNSMAPTQHVVGNYGHHMLNVHFNAFSQRWTGPNRAHILSTVPLDMVAIQYGMRYDQGHMPATLYGLMGDRPVLGPVEAGINDAIASQGHMSASVYDQMGSPYPDRFATGHYQSNMVPYNPPSLAPFQFNGNMVPSTIGAQNGVPFDFGATNPQYDTTFQPDLRNAFSFNVHRLQAEDLQAFNPNNQLGPSLIGKFEVFLLFHDFPQEIQDMIFECMFPGPRTEHLGLLVHESYGRRQEYRVELPITLFICQRSRYITSLRYTIIERPKKIKNGRKIYGLHVTKIDGKGNITQPRPLCIGPHDTLAISVDIPTWALKQTLEWLEYLDLKIPGGLKSIKHLEVRDNHTKSTNFLEDAVALSNVVGFFDFSPLLPSIFTNGILDKFSSLEKLTLTNVEKNGKNRHAFNEEERVFLWYMIADHLDKATGLGENRFVETENIEIKEYERVQGKKLGLGKEMIYFYYFPKYLTKHFPVLDS
ncbi:hypothetical protein EAF04_006027 [Stromatinia cepivora]|nr:hypothetical protein EAF04_006027 [Stromatinia cepivora]